jgi:hypothetical protein
MSFYKILPPDLKADVDVNDDDNNNSNNHNYHHEILKESDHLLNLYP